MSFNYKNKKRGVSIIGTLIGFSLLGLSVVALSTYMGHFEQASFSLGAEAEHVHLHSELLEGMKRILVQVDQEVASSEDSITNAKERQNGICKMIKDTQSSETPQTQEKTLRNIQIGATHYTIPDKRWKYFIGAAHSVKKDSFRWEVQPDSECANGSNGFFGISNDTPASKKTKCFSLNEDTYAFLTIEAKTLPNFESFISGTKPVNDVVFDLTSIISSKQVNLNDPDTDTYRLSKGQRFVSAVDAYECNFKYTKVDSDDSSSTEDVPYRVRLSPGSLGTASYKKDLYYHSTQTSSSISSCPIDDEGVELSNINSQKGLIAATDVNYLQTDLSNTNKISCMTKKFVCPRRSGQQIAPYIGRIDFYNYMKAQVNVNVNEYLQTSINRMSFSIENKDPNLNPSLSSRLSYNDIKGMVTNANQESYRLNQRYSGEGYGDFPLYPGSNILDIYIHFDSEEFQDLCQQTCFYSSSSVYKPFIKIESHLCDVEKSFEEGSFGCTFCAKENCNSLESNTMSSIQEPEPLDAVIPQCAAEELESLVYKEDDNPLQLAGSDVNKTEHCLMMEEGLLKVIGCEENDEYERVACFVGGKLKAIEKQEGYNAENGYEDTCYVQSKISVDKGSGTSGFLGLLSQFHGVQATGSSSVESTLEDQSLPVVNTQYEFYNSAQQGMRLASKHRDFDDGLKVLYPLEREGSLQISPSLPVIAPTALKENDLKSHWAFFYKEWEDRFFPHLVRLKGLQLSNNTLIHELEKPTDPTKVAFLLLNHIHYRGLYLVDKNAAGQFPFLCIKKQKGEERFLPDRVLITDESNSYEQGYKKCAEQNAAFIPPNSPEMWAASMLKVKEHTEGYPFPLPYADSEDRKYIFNKTTDGLEKVKAAWVALEPKIELTDTVYEEGSGDSFSRIASWRVDLAKVAKEENKSLPANSIFRSTTELASDAFSKEGFTGFIDNEGYLFNKRELQTVIPVERKRASYADDHGIRKDRGYIFADSDRFQYLCRYTSSERNIKKHRAIKVQNTPCSEDIEELEVSDLIELKKGVRSMLDIYNQVYSEVGTYFILNKDKFCASLDEERKRRYEGRKFLNAWYNNKSNIIMQRKGYVENHVCEIAWQHRVSTTNTCPHPAFQSGKSHFITECKKGLGADPKDDEILIQNVLKPYPTYSGSPSSCIKITTAEIDWNYSEGLTYPNGDFEEIPEDAKGAYGRTNPLAGVSFDPIAHLDCISDDHDDPSVIGTISSSYTSCGNKLTNIDSNDWTSLCNNLDATYNN